MGHCSSGRRRYRRGATACSNWRRSGHRWPPGCGDDRHRARDVARNATTPPRRPTRRGTRPRRWQIVSARSRLAIQAPGHERSPRWSAWCKNRPDGEHRHRSPVARSRGTRRRDRTRLLRATPPSRAARAEGGRGFAVVFSEVPRPAFAPPSRHRRNPGHDPAVAARHRRREGRRVAGTCQRTDDSGAASGVEHVEAGVS